MMGNGFTGISSGGGFPIYGGFWERLWGSPWDGFFDDDFFNLDNGFFRRIEEWNRDLDRWIRERLYNHKPGKPEGPVGDGPKGSKKIEVKGTDNKDTSVPVKVGSGVRGPQNSERGANTTPVTITETTELPGGGRRVIRRGPGIYEETVTRTRYSPGFEEFMRGLMDPHGEVYPEKHKAVEKSKRHDFGEVDLKNHWQVKEQLDRYLLKQDDYKMALAVALKDFIVRRELGDPTIKKSNILVVGPTGVGKSYGGELIAEMADLPFVKINCSGRSGEGYVGESLSDFAEKVKAEITNHYGEFTPEGNAEGYHAVIFLDEIDKVAKNPLAEHEGYSRILENEMIGWLEEAEVKGVNTKNFLFIGAGAFSEMDEILKRKGRKYDPKNVSPQDLVDYGFAHELVGRFPHIVTLEPLDKEDLKRIILESEDSVLKQNQKLLEAGYKAKLEITDDALDRITEYTAAQNTGARGLQGTMEKLLLKAKYKTDPNADNGKIVINERLVNQYLQEKM